jgi:hypothetical protein
MVWQLVWLGEREREKEAALIYIISQFLLCVTSSNILQVKSVGWRGERAQQPKIANLICFKPFHSCYMFLFLPLSAV